MPDNLMSSTYPWVTIEDIADSHKGAIKIGPFGSQLKKDELTQKGYKVYGQENVIANDFTIGERRVSASKFATLQSCQLYPGDVVLSMMGTIGHCTVFPKDAEVGIMDSHLLRIQVNSQITYPEFVALAIGAENIVGYQITRMSHGSIMSGLSSTIVRGLEIPLPSLPEQHRIAEILDAADATIRHTERVIAKLRQVKAGLLHDLLTRGLDAHGHLRDPHAHPEQFKDSPLGRIPRVWEVLQLAEVSEQITSGSRGWAAYYADQGPLFLRIGNLTREHINLRFDNVVHVQPPPGTEGARTKVQESDVLISITADLGIIGVIPKDFGEAYVNQHIALVRINTAKTNPRWVGTYLSGAQAGPKQFYRLNDIGAKAGMNLPTTGALLVALPPIWEQDAIVAILDFHDTRIRAEESTLAKLRQLKRGLMDDLLTGRVRVV